MHLLKMKFPLFVGILWLVGVNAQDPSPVQELGIQGCLNRAHEMLALKYEINGTHATLVESNAHYIHAQSETTKQNAQASSLWEFFKVCVVKTYPTANRAELRSNQFVVDAIENDEVLKDHCLYDENIDCTGEDAKKYRRPDGKCNNLKNPTWGAAATLQRRLDRTYYDDERNLGLLPRSRSNAGLEQSLPNPRTVSRTIHRNPTLQTKDGSVLSLQAWPFGQFVDHDIILTPEEEGPGGVIPDCCGEDASNRHVCQQFNAESGDPKFDTSKCFAMVRSTPGLRCTFEPREQVNELTSFLDNSNVYGSSYEELHKLRDDDGASALLKTYTPTVGRSLLPTTDDPVFECHSREGHDCHNAGDARVDEQPSLATYHTIFVREHNRIVQFFRQKDAFKDEADRENRTFNEARKILNAEYQHIVYSEFLPAFLAQKTMNDYKLTVGEKYKYEDDKNPSISSEFGICYRQGHTWIPNVIKHLYPDGTEVIEPATRFTDITSNIFVPDFTYGQGENGIPGIVRYLDEPMPETDAEIEQNVCDNLFMTFDDAANDFIAGTGADLPAFNVQRARDHGTTPYNALRKYFGLAGVFTKPGGKRKYPAHSDKDIMDKLDDLYQHEDDIDLWPGGLSEAPWRGSLLGELFNHVLGEGFGRLKFNDRFWYESSDTAFTDEQLAEIRKSSMARLLCDNVYNNGNAEVTENVFMQEASYKPCLARRKYYGRRTNPIKLCSEVDEVDLEKFLPEEATIKREKEEMSLDKVEEELDDILGYLLKKQAP